MLLGGAYAVLAATRLHEGGRGALGGTMVTEGVAVFCYFREGGVWGGASWIVAGRDQPSPQNIVSTN